MIYPTTDLEQIEGPFSVDAARTVDYYEEHYPNDRDKQRDMSDAYAAKAAGLFLVGGVDGWQFRDALESAWALARMANITPRMQGAAEFGWTEHRA